MLIITISTSSIVSNEIIISISSWCSTGSIISAGMIIIISASIRASTGTGISSG